MQFSNIGAVCQLDKDRHFSWSLGAPNKM